MANVFESFVTEATRLLQTFQSDLSELVTSRELDPARLNSVFRSAHSLKGLASMFGLDSVADLANSAEDALDALRHGRLDLTPKLADALQRAGSILKSQVAERQRGEARPETATEAGQLITDFSTFLAKAQPALGTSANLVALLSDKELAAGLSEYERHRIFVNLARGSALYRVRMTWNLSALERGMEVTVKALSAIGEVVSTLPAPQSPDRSKVPIQLLVCTQENAAGISKAVGPKAKVELIGSPLATSGSARHPSVVRARLSPELSANHLHELRLDLSSHSIRVELGKVDAMLGTVGELQVVRRNLERLATSEAGVEGAHTPWKFLEGLRLQTRTLETRLGELQRELLDVRMVPVHTFFEQQARLMATAIEKSRKQVRIEVAGGDVQLDRAIVEELAEPLMHLMRNAIDHGIERPDTRKAAGKPPEGCITLEARQVGNRVVVEVEDDGRGLDRRAIAATALSSGIFPADQIRAMTDSEIVRLIFNPGFSTSSKSAALSGRGVGLDVVKTNLARLMAHIEVESRVGKGTKFVLTLPLTLAVTQATVIEVSGRSYALPSSSVLELLTEDGVSITESGGGERFLLNDIRVPLLRLGRIFGHPETAESRRLIVVLGVSQERFGLLVDDVKGQHDVVLKPLRGVLAKVPGIAGTTELSDRSTVLMLDVAALLAESRPTPTSMPVQPPNPGAPTPEE